MSEELHRVGDWMKVFRRIRFANTRDGVRGATIKAVGTMLASYANYADGTCVFPGTARVAVDCEIDYRTAKKCVAALRDVGLIVLVRKAERRHLADEYRLDIPEDLLERTDIELWAPDRYESEINRVKAANRGTYKPKSKDDSLRVTEGTADTDLRDMAGTAEPLPPDQSAGHAGHRRDQSAGHADPNLRGTPCPPTYQSNNHPSELPYDEEVCTDLTVPSNEPDQEDQISAPVDIVTRPRCPHGRSSRRNKDGTMRCPDCQAAEHAPPVLSPARCTEHGLKGGNRLDGKPHCPLCRRLQAIAPPTLERA